MRTNSIEAYREIKSNGLLSKRRLEVYQILFKHGPLTGSQVSSRWKSVMGERNSENIRNRITELIKTGVVYIVKDVLDENTNMKVSLFDVNSEIPVKIKQEQSKTSLIREGRRLMIQNETLESGQMKIEIENWIQKTKHI